jgi:hypothetical protein
MPILDHPWVNFALARLRRAPESTPAEMYQLSIKKSYILSKVLLAVTK